MIVAPFAIASGAADIALLMMSSSVTLPEGILCCCALASPEMRRTEQPKISVSFRMQSPPQLGHLDYSTPGLKAFSGIRASHSHPRRSRSHSDLGGMRAESS